MINQKRKKKNIKANGYTLVEVMVVIALTAIVSTLIVAGLQSGRSKDQVRQAQDELASAIKLAQSFALQGRMQGTNIPKCYGVSGSSGGAQYVIYSSSNADCSSPAPVETHPFSSGVKFGADFDFGFDVPHGNVVKGGGTSASLSKGTTTKHVTLGAGGGVSRD